MSRPRFCPYFGAEEGIFDCRFAKQSGVHKLTFHAAACAIVATLVSAIVYTVADAKYSAGSTKRNRRTIQSRPNTSRGMLHPSSAPIAVGQPAPLTLLRACKPLSPRLPIDSLAAQQDRRLHSPPFCSNLLKASGLPLEASAVSECRPIGGVHKIGRHRSLVAVVSRYHCLVAAQNSRMAGLWLRTNNPNSYVCVQHERKD